MWPCDPGKLCRPPAEAPTLFEKLLSYLTCTQHQVQERHFSFTCIRSTNLYRFLNDSTKICMFSGKEYMIAWPMLCDVAKLCRPPAEAATSFEKFSSYLRCTWQHQVQERLFSFTCTRSTNLYRFLNNSTRTCIFWKGVRNHVTDVMRYCRVRSTVAWSHCLRTSSLKFALGWAIFGSLHQASLETTSNILT